MTQIILVIVIINVFGWWWGALAFALLLLDMPSRGNRRGRDCFTRREDFEGLRGYGTYRRRKGEKYTRSNDAEGLTHDY